MNLNECFLDFEGHGPRWDDVVAKKKNNMDL